MAIEPEHAPARLNLGWVSLLNGDLERGWRELAWYDEHGDRARRYFEQPRWSGVRFPGQTLLLWADEAIGDTIQFIRYTRRVRALGGRVIVECEPRLVPLLDSSRTGIEEVVARGAPLPDFDIHAPVGHLPHLLQTRLGTVPAEIPYLAVDDDRVDAWCHRLGPKLAIRVGLVWSGEPSRKNAATRFSSLDAFASLAELRGVQFINLQHGAPVSQLLTPPPGLTIEVFPEESWSILETAALICNVDVVVTVDTMIAHLAGAMGRPVWTLLAFAADWRWLAHGDSSPWYPTMRLFRQEKPGDWHGVMERVRAALEDWSNRTSHSVCGITRRDLPNTAAHDACGRPR